MEFVDPLYMVTSEYHVSLVHPVDPVDPMELLDPVDPVDPMNLVNPVDPFNLKKILFNSISINSLFKTV